LTASCIYAADKIDDKPVDISTEDAEMKAAIDHARATLDEFFQIYANPPKGASDFKLKVKFTDSNGAEHMWVTPFRQSNSVFVGILADDPERVTNVKGGQEVTFGRERISDWGYVLNGKQKGSFTVCVVFKHLPPAEVQRYRSDYGFEC
jgi:uncharacterized protein YegJ (DUF2314 family)